MAAFRLSRLVRAAGSVSSEIRNKLLLTLSSPTEAVFIREAVESVTLPGVEGSFTVTNNHSQCVTQLKPGVVTVRRPTEEPKTYFMSGGFFFFKSPTGDLGCCTAEVSAVELVPTETLSKEDATKLLSDIASAPKETEWDKARALLAQDFLNTVIRAAP